MQCAVHGDRASAMETHLHGLRQAKGGAWAGSPLEETMLPDCKYGGGTQGRRETMK